MRIDFRSAAVGVVLGAVVASGVTAAVRATPFRSENARDAARPSASTAAPIRSANVDGETDAATAREAAWATANVRLAEDIAEYRRSLQANEAERGELAKKLAASEARLAALGDAGAPSRSPFELTRSDWARMSKDGELRYRVPCERKTPWTPDGKTLQLLGLRPEDAAPIREAYRRSNERVWASIRPLCAGILGSDALADRLGSRVCTRVIEGTVADDDEAAAMGRAVRVGQVRAGLRAEPAPSEVPPHEALLLTFTAEVARFEADLAATFGPEEARRITYDDAICAWDSWTGHPTVHR